MLTLISQKELKTNYSFHFHYIVRNGTVKNHRACISMSLRSTNKKPGKQVYWLLPYICTLSIFNYFSHLC